MNIAANTNIREIGYVASRYANNKGRKSELSNHLKFYQSNPNPCSTHVTKPAIYYELTIKTLVKKQLRDTVQAFKKYVLDIPSFIASVKTELGKHSLSMPN